MAFQEQLRNQQQETRLFANRAIIAGLIVSLLVMVLLYRLYYLQYLNYGHYSTLSKNNRVRIMSMPPTRGSIFDRNGEILADNLPSYQLEITPELVKDIPETLKKLQKLVNISEAERKRFYRALKRKHRFEGIPLKFNLNDQEVARISVNLHRFPGVSVQARLSRHYPNQTQAAHTVGYVGNINEKELKQIDSSNYAGTSHIGKIGIERYYEDKLHGKVGHQQVEVNVEGRILRVLNESPPIPGDNLYLTIDSKLQQIAEKAMGSYSGAVIAMDPNNGEILAIVSKPGFNPNLFVNGISSKDYRRLSQDSERPLFNRSISGQYPPGSTIKPMVGWAGLENGLISSHSKIHCKGYFTLPNDERKYRDWKKTGHGLVNLDKAVAQSCDVFFYELALRLSIDKISAMMKKFGFGQRTGIDNIGEAKGILPSREWKQKTRHQPWYPGETLITGIGQGYFTVTPIQLALATSLIANKGKMIQPHLLLKVDSKELGITETQPIGPLPYKHIGSEKNWQVVDHTMIDVVHSIHGTARRIGQGINYQIAGKTGTAQVYTIAQDEEYDKHNTAYKLRDHALFISYAPVKDPQIVVVSVAEHGGSGSSVAAPIAKKVIDYYLKHKAKEKNHAGL